MAFIAVQGQGGSAVRLGRPVGLQAGVVSLEAGKANGNNAEKDPDHLLTVLLERFALDPKASI